MKLKSILIILLFLYNIVNSQDTFTSIRTGVWNDPTSIVPSATTPWSYTGSDADGIPDEDDIVVINVGHTVSLPSGNTRIKDLTLDGTLDIPLGSKLYLWANTGASSFTLNGSVTGDGEIVTVSYNSIMSGTGSVGSTVDLWVANLFSIDGMTLDFADQVKLQGVTLNIINGANITFSGNVFTISSLCKFQNQATIIINTTNFFSTGPSTSQILRCNYANSTVIFPLNEELPIPFDNFMNLTITGNSEFDGDFSVKGDWVNNGVFESLEDNNTITFDGSTAQQISGSGTTTLKKLILNNASGLTISGTTLNIDQVLQSSSGTITNSSSSVILKSSSSNNAGMLKVSSTSGYSGNITAERYFNATSNGYRMVGSPIENTTLADWQYPSTSNGFIYCGFSGSNYTWIGCGGYCNVRFYDETQATDADPDAGLDTATNVSNLVTPARGTIIYSSAGVNKLSVTGEPEIDNFSVSISKGSNDSDRGWNLISNPYPCTLDWAAFRAANTIIDNAQWIYSGDNGNYVQSTNNIPHSQGFWVKKTSTGTSNLNFNISQTVATEQSFTKSTNGINLPLKLKLTSNVNNYADFASLNSGQNFSNGYDPGDDIFKLMSPIPDYAPNIYFLDNQGHQLDLSCINNNQSVDLFFDTRIGQYANGNYEIVFDNTSQFMIGSCLTVEDLHTGIITDLRQDTVISFVSDSTAPFPRFIMHINVDYDINVTNVICYEDTNAVVTITGNQISGSIFSLLQDTNVISSIQSISDSLSFIDLAAGSYTFQTSHNSSCSVSNQEIIITQPVEIISYFSVISDSLLLDSTSQIQFKNLSSGGSCYYWDFGDGNISNDINPFHSFSYVGTYLVTLTVTNDSTGLCSSIYSSTINVVNPISDIFSTDKISGLSIIQLNNNIEIEVKDHSNILESIALYDLNGQLICQKSSLSLSKISLDNLNIESGIYLIGVNLSDNTNINLKFFYNSLSN